MKTNLIQAYVYNNPKVQHYNSDKAKQNFDVHKELSNRTFIQPLPSNGYLVKNTIFDIPSEIFRDQKYNLKALKHSLKGKANDHELGCLNDVGMKLGGLAIATYLYSRKSTPLSKVMEFVGLTTFFMAMDIWPKLALQLPAYLIHGFDIRQKYVDNYGTKKPVFLDHQFIPWDLYSDDDINKIGDKMGVDKNMKNRRDFIQEKMRKIALQNNTMWMLTSGFATPILSALICNALEKPINRYQDGLLERKSENLLQNFEKYEDKFSDKTYIKRVSKILDDNKGKTVTQNLYREIVDAVSHNLDSGVKRAIEIDLDRILYAQKGYDFNTQTLTNLREVLKEQYSKINLSENELEKILPSSEELHSAYGQLLLNDKGNIDFSKHNRVLLKLLDEKINTYAASGANPEIVEDLRFVTDTLVHSKGVLDKPVLLKVMQAKPSAALSPSIITQIKEVANVLSDYKKRMNVLNEYIYNKAAQAPETILANCWNNVADGLLDIFNFSSKDIENARYDREFASKILREKFDKIAADDKLYSKVIEQLEKKLSYLKEKTAFGEMDSMTVKDNLYLQKVKVTFDSVQKGLADTKMYQTLTHLVGHNRGDSQAVENIYLTFMKDRVQNVRSSFYRILNTLDMYRRISKLENIGALNAIEPRVSKEEVVELCKQILLGGHSSDYAVKFYNLIDMDINPTDLTEEQMREFLSDIEVKGGMVLNKFLGKKPVDQLADNAYDKKAYEAAMRLMYKENLHTDTLIKIENSPFFDDFVKYRNEVFNIFGADRYFAKVWHVIKNTFGGVTSEYKFNMLASAPDEMIFKLCSRRYNSNKWQKIFRPFALGLLGVTVLSQFFMGKTGDKNLKESD